MDEWWTYGPNDFLLFSPRTYYRLFELHNAALWPGQVAALAAGIVILIMMTRPGPWQRPVIGTLLAIVWFAVAWFFFHKRYQTINWAADYAAMAFTIEAILLAVWSIVQRPFALPAGRRSHAIIALIVFALVIQPLIGPLLGRNWRGMEIFAIVPDPTVTASLAVIVCVRSRLRWLLMVVPLLWCGVTALTEWTMGSPEFFVMPMVGLVAIALAISSPAIRRGSRHLSA